MQVYFNIVGALHGSETTTYFVFATFWHCLDLKLIAYQLKKNMIMINLNKF